MQIETKPAKEFKQFLPDGYRKRDVRVERRGPGPADVTSYWDGGSCDKHWLHRGGRCEQVSRSPGFPQFTAQVIELLPGDVFVEGGVMCGKQATLRISFVE
jgi:hypothetical protein